MGRRNFPSFLDAYFDFARSEYAPDKFTHWVGISIVAAVLERRVWLQEGSYRNFPNLFVLLTSGPGVGKTSAIRKGASLFNRVRERIHDQETLRIIEGTTTAAGLREQMSRAANMPGGDFNPYSSIYCVGKEGSDSALKNHGDDFRSLACSMYDCEEKYQFNTKEKGLLSIPQPVMNMLVGVTFDFLGSVIDQNSVFGGLASRFTYVIEKDDRLRGEFFGSGVVLEDGLVHGEEAREDTETKRKLVEDLFAIHSLYGNVRTQKKAFGVVEEWFREFKKDYEAMGSDRMKAIEIRKRALLKKLLIILTVSESDDLLIRPHHAEKAIELVKDVTKDNPYIMNQAIMADLNSAKGATQFILNALRKRNGKATRGALKALLLSNGNDLTIAEKSFDTMIAAGWIESDPDGKTLLLRTDPDNHL